jgi:DNA-binding LacI/PurR family transcriptional regulator
MFKSRLATVRSIAALAGVSCATVTRALRNDHNVRDATRAKVMAAANELGYHRNPLTSSVMSHIRGGRASTCRGKLAWLNANSNPTAWEDVPWRRPLHEGARRRAGQLGYILEDVWLADPRLTREKLTRMLLARGIQGLIIPEDHASLADLRWQSFAAVTTSKSGYARWLDRAGTDHKRGIAEVFAELRQRGYQRFGLMIHELVDRVSEGDIRAAYLLATDGLPARAKVPILLLDPPAPRRASPSNLALFSDWVARNRPEVVICGDEHVLEWTRTMNLKIPDELGLVHLDRHAYLTQWAGIDQREDQIGAALVDQVVAQLIRGELGIPSVPKDVLIRGCWVDGATVRPPPQLPAATTRE